MKKILDLSSWSRWSQSLSKGAVIGSIQRVIASTKCVAISLVLLAFLAACDDSSSASAENSEPAALSSAEEQGSSSSSRHCEECNDETISSDSNAESNGSSSSSSSEKLSEASSSSADEMESSSSSVALATPCKTETEDNCEYGTVLDDRDDQTYKTVKIGDQWWMAENLNYETANSDWYKKYGRLYTWAAAIDSVKLATDVDNPLDCGYDKTCGLSGKVQGVCPEGWHLPSYDEWNTLFTAVGGQSTAGKVLKSQTGWTAYDGITNEDAFGFSALPAGFKYSIGVGDYDYEGFYAHFWSSTEYGSDYAYGMVLYYNGGNVNQGDYDKYVGFSVRCVKD